MIKISLSNEELLGLKKVRSQASSKDSEKALMVIMSHEGKTVSEIAKILKRNKHTIRDWLKRYKKKGLVGLQRKFSPGRPAEKRNRVKKRLKELFMNSPEAYGYTDTFWTIRLLMYDHEKHFGEKISDETISRALADMGFSYKRARKTTPTDTISDEQKRTTFKTMLSKIKKLTKDKDCEIYAVDESHFSTMPYLVKGWFLKRCS